MRKKKSAEDDSTTVNTIAVAMLTVDEKTLIDEIIYVNCLMIKEFFQTAVDFFIDFRSKYEEDTSVFLDHGIYYTYGKKEQVAKLSVLLGAEYRQKVDAIAKEDDREIRTVMRSAVIQYLNHLKKTGKLKTYEENIERRKNIEKLDS